MGTVLTTLAQEAQVREESLWFGGPERPLFGRLTTPRGETTLGGVLISPPIGQESRQARRALRTLAIQLAIQGYVSLRYDHFGTGDSSGSLNDDEFDIAWLEGVEQGVALLRSFGISAISAVGMRMGATIVGSAAASFDLGLRSFVLWDPCESGRGYAREMRALGALRRTVLTVDTDGPTRMAEYPLSDYAVSRLRRFDLTAAASPSLAERVMVVVRSDRGVSSAFETHWSSENVLWTSTTEQGPMLESLLPETIQPTSTIEQIRAWLTEPSSAPEAFSSAPLSRDATLSKAPNVFAVRETVMDLGPEEMFAVLTEPVGDAQGPLVVMVNGVNEDHVGPARLWVELSRRWASLGFRCVRFDLSELGESPWLPSHPDRPVFDKTRSRDVSDAVRAVSRSDPSNSVLIGYCSGAQLAIEVALELKTRGVCGINPQVGAGVFLNVEHLEVSDRESIRSFARRVESVLERHQWIDRMQRPVSRLVLRSKFGGDIVFRALKLSSPCPPKVRSALVKNGTKILLLMSAEDLSPLRRVPILGPILRRRLTSSENFDVQIVPGLDHAFLSTLGRGRAVELLDHHIVETFTDAGRAHRQ